MERPFIIDAEFEHKIPALKAEEFESLERNILADGKVNNPLIVWDEENILVDGHHRWKVIEKHPEIPYTIERKSFADRYAVIAWMCKNQLGTRNLDDASKGLLKSYLIGVQYNAQKMSLGGHGGNRYKKVENPARQDSLQCKPSKVSEQIGKATGYGHDKVEKDGAFAKGIDALEAVSAGTRDIILSGSTGMSKEDIGELRKKSQDELKEIGDKVLAGESFKKVPKKKEVAPSASKAEQPAPNVNGTDNFRVVKDAIYEAFADVDDESKRNIKKLPMAYADNNSDDTNSALMMFENTCADALTQIALQIHVLKDTRKDVRINSLARAIQTTINYLEDVLKKEIVARRIRLKKK